MQNKGVHPTVHISQFARNHSNLVVISVFFSLVCLRDGQPEKQNWFEECQTGPCIESTIWNIPPCLQHLLEVYSTINKSQRIRHVPQQQKNLLTIHEHLLKHRSTSCYTLKSCSFLEGTYWKEHFVSWREYRIFRIFLGHAPVPIIIQSASVAGIL